MGERHAFKTASIYLNKLCVVFRFNNHSINKLLKTYIYSMYVHMYVYTVCMFVYTHTYAYIYCIYMCVYMYCYVMYQTGEAAVGLRIMFTLSRCYIGKPC